MYANVIFFETETWQEQYLRGQLSDELSLAFVREPLSEDNVELASGFQIVSPFIYSRLDGHVLTHLPDLRLIATRSTGFDHIDLVACAERGITISNVPSYGENTVAEHTFALILALSRKILPSVTRTRRGNFDLQGLMGIDLAGKTIGVIGAGHIGQHVIRIARGLEMDVVVYDVKRDESLAKSLDFRYLELNDLLSASDVITMHAPYNRHTHHMLNRDNMDYIKSGAILINTSRGALIETAALVEKLQTGILSGVGLDVLEEEGFIKEEAQLLSPESGHEQLRVALETHLLLFRDDVIITPHNAFNSYEAIKRILDTTIENINSFLLEKPRNVIGGQIAA